MGDAGQLFDLAARISISTADTDKVLASTNQKVMALEKEVKTLEARLARGSAAAKSHGDAHAHAAGQMLAARNAIRILGSEVGEVLPEHLGHAVRQMAYLDSSASAVGEAFALLATPVGAGVAAAAGIALVGAASVTTLYEMAGSAAKTGNDLLSMSQKTGLSVETLQALDEAAKVTGSSLDRIVQSVGIFEKRITEADGADTRLAAGFKKLGIDSSDANKALGQVIEFLGKFPAGITRTGVAMDIFGRAGKDMAAITDEMKGSLKDYTDEMIKMGEIIGTDDVTAARDFIREQDKLGKQWEVIKFKIESAATPIVEDWLKNISAWLLTNQNDIIAWGKTFVTTLGDIASAAGFVIDVLKTMGQMATLSGPFSIPASGPRPYANDPLANPQPMPPGMPGGPSLNYTGPTETKIPYYLAAPTATTTKPPPNPFAGGGKHKGGGGGDPAAEARRLAEISLRVVLDSFKEEENALARSLSTRRSSLEDYTTKAIDLANRERNATMDALKKEEQFARTLKKGRAVELAEIGLKRQQAERKDAESITKYIDGLLDEWANRDKIREEGMLRVHEIVGKQESDLWQALADQRMVTQETAVKAIGQIEMKGLLERMAMAQSEYNRAGKDKTKQLEASMRMAEIESQIGALSAENDRKAGTALRSRLAAQRDFNATLEQTLGNMQLQSLELQKQGIQHQGDLSGKITTSSRRSIDNIELAEEDIQSQLAKRQLFLNLQKDMEGKSFAERIQLYEQFVTARDLLEQQHAQTIKEIQDRPLMELAQEMRPIADSIAGVLSNSIRTGFEHGAQAGFTSMLQGFTQMLAQMAEQMLANAIFKMLLGVFGGSGGGIGSIIASGAGSGGHSGLPGFSRGGIVSGVDKGFDSVLAMLRPGERVIPVGGSSGGGNTVHVTLNYNAAPGENPASKQTVHQLMKQLHEGLAKVQLTG